jgi:predicted O-methyltransferase YrrM
MDFPEAWQHVESVEGWLTNAQGRTLFETAKTISPGHWIVEIGSHFGRSTVLLAAAKPDGVGLLAVDPFDDPRWGGGADAMTSFRSTLSSADLLDEITTFRGVSADASKAWDGKPIAMLFVDGAHDRDSVLVDIDGWSPHLTPDADMLFHDAFSSPGVTFALIERYLGRSGNEYLGSVGSLAHVRKTPHAPRVKSTARILLRLPWFARNLAVKISIRRRWTFVQRVLRHEGSAYPY